jgi:DNA-binding MarR family transcriptional regulator
MAPKVPEGANKTYRRYVDAVGLHGLAAAEAAGLHATDWYALSLLDLAGPLTSGELATRINLTTGATTRLIDRLEQAGHVRRVADPSDRRRVVVEPTPTPAVDLDPILAPARERIGALIAEYSEDEIRVLFDFFAKAAPAFEQAATEIRRQSPPRRKRTKAPVP